MSAATSRQNDSILASNTVTLILYKSWKACTKNSSLFCQCFEYDK